MSSRHSRRKAPEAAVAPAAPRAWSRGAVRNARIAVLLIAPVLFLLAAEGGLRLVGYGHPASYFVPARDRGVIEPNPRFGWRFFGADLNRLPTPQLVVEHKPANTYRIVVLGASAARGEPNPAFSFGRILETMLTAVYPGTRFEVINTGMTAINSHVVLPIARECVDLDPDLFIVYMGNNEVVGPYGPGSVITGFLKSSRAVRANLWLRGTRVGQLLAAAGRVVGRSAADSRQDWGGMEMFLAQTVAADDSRLDQVYANFAANLRDICAASAGEGVPVILSTVLTNLVDQPPLASLHRGDLSAVDGERWRSLVDEGTKLASAGDGAGAVERFRAAEAVDDRYAELSYRLGRELLALGRLEEARTALERARDLDALRFRADSRINAIIRQVAEAQAARGVHFLDAAASVRYPGPPPEPIPGRELFYEHVHLTFPGNYLMAASLFGQVQPLLPASVRGNRPAPPPPTPAECGARLVYSPYDICADAMKIARITKRPPFPPAQGQRDLDRASEFESRLTEQILDGVDQAYRRSLSERAGDLLMRSNYADFLLSRGRAAPAAAQWRELLARYPDSSDWQTSLGNALRELGRDAEAVSAYEGALQVNPVRVDALNGLAVSLQRLGRLKPAERALGKALRIRPNDPGANYEQGRLELRKGNPTQARARFLRALDSQPDTPAFYRELGRTLAGPQAALAEPLTLADIRAGDLLEFLHGAIGVSMSADWPSLSAVGVSPGTRVGLALSDVLPERMLAAAAAAMGDGVVYRRTAEGIVFAAAATPAANRPPEASSSN